MELIVKKSTSQKILIHDGLSAKIQLPVGWVINEHPKYILKIITIYTFLCGKLQKI